MNKDDVAILITELILIVCYIICLIGFIKNTLFEKDVCHSIFWGILYLQTSININRKILEEDD